MRSVWDRIDAELTRRGQLWAALGRKIGASDQTMYHWKARGVPPSRYKAIADALGPTLDDLLDEHWTPTQHLATGVGRYPVAQEMSAYRFDHVPTLTLEHAMDWSTLPEQFEAAMPDDALAPDYPRGMLLVWSCTKAPRAGSVVLLKDRHGHPHVREYRPGIDPHQWSASAINRAYPALGPDSATIMATARYAEMP